MFIGSTAIAQDSNNGDKLDKGLERKADNLFLSENYAAAAPLLRELLESKPNDGYLQLSLGICYLKIPQDKTNGVSRKKALELLKSAVDKVEFIDATYFLAVAYHLNYQFEDAIKYYKLYSKKLAGHEPELAYPYLRQAEIQAALRKEIEHAEHGIELMKDTVDVVYTNMGPQINSPYEEYAPAVSADDEVLIFTSRRPSGEKHEHLEDDGMYDEDIYITFKQEGAWQPAHPLLGNVNTKKHDASIGLSADAQKLFVYHKGDIYVSDLDGRYWTKPESFGSAVNSPWQETHISMNAARNLIVFSSDRPGGQGGKDLYSARLQPDGSWGEVTNLGPTINTKDDEDAPFIHPDDHMLYFSSTGHNSMGGYDIFYTEMDDKTDKWSEPKNLGYPINTPEDDIFFAVSSNGRSGYLSTVREDGYGKKDIYHASLTSHGEVPLTVVRGIIRGSHGVPMQAEFMVRDGETGDMIGVYKSNAVTGKYLLVFPPGRKYDILVSAENYLPHFEKVTIPPQERFYDLFQEVQLTPAMAMAESGDTLAGQQIIFRNAFFDIDSAVSLVDTALAGKQVKEVVYSTFVGWLDDPKKKAAIAAKTQNLPEMQTMISSYKPSKQIHLATPENPGVLQQETFGYQTVWATSLQSPSKVDESKENLALVTEQPYYPSKEELDTAKENFDAIFAIRDVEEQLDELTEDETWLANPAIAKADEDHTEQTGDLVASEEKLADIVAAKEIEEIKETKKVENKAKNEEVAVSTEPSHTTTSVGKKSTAHTLLAKILFDFNQASLRQESKQNLDEVADLLKKRPDIEIEIDGFTCSKGSDAYNEILSEQRTESVKSYFTSKGIDAERVHLNAMGEDDPIARNDNESNMALNRRAEIKALTAITDWTVAVDEHHGKYAPDEENGESSTQTSSNGLIAAAICTGVTNREPEGSSNSFSAAQGRLFCYSQVGATSSGTIHHKWYLEDKEMADIELHVGGYGWRTWSSKHITGAMKGNWKVEITDTQGAVIETLRFTVNE
ncbi:MAG: DUF2914 domain-containing protein [Flavobacteriales bacterium]|nr:DUF2914 domain-containing protein [Flavobacteriales bacterium]MCB9449477.1 DUF2914 domain-containing protein [Flavobacteriales bacterium]